MNELPQDSNAEALSRLLRRINQGIDPKLLRKEANQLISRITPDDIATAEQRLVKDGYSARLASQLAAAFVLMGILEGQTLNLKNQLPPSHVLRMVLAEHDMLRCFLADLQEVAERSLPLKLH